MKRHCVKLKGTVRIGGPATSSRSQLTIPCIHHRSIASPALSIRTTPRFSRGIITSSHRLSLASRHIETRSIFTSSSHIPGEIKTIISPIPNTTSKVATVTVSNAPKLNIVNSALLASLTSAFTSLRTDDPGLRCVVLNSTPHLAKPKSASFIGGADIKEMSALTAPQQAREFITQIHKLNAAIRTCPIPVLASIHGFCLGAGMEIAASCDLRLATSASVFGMPEVRVGIPSVVEARLLCDLIGWGRTRRMLLLGENIDAATAERWGLVEEVVSNAEELERKLGEWVGLIARNGRKAVRSQKTLMREWEGCRVEEGIEAGVDAFAEAFEDGGVEPREMMGSFLGRKRGE